MSESTLETISRELTLIRKSIRRNRNHTVLLALSFVIAIAIGIVAFVDDNNDDRRERDNLVFVLKSRCEAHNRERIEDAEVLIQSAAGPDPDEETKATIDAYRRQLERTETDCDAEVESLLP